MDEDKKKGTIQSDEKVPPTDTCPICQDEMINGPEIRTLPCSHKFHSDCIKKWIEMRNLCPLCKRVADIAHPVRELDDDRQDLTQNMIDTLLSGAINRSGVDFWMQLLEGSNLLQSNIRNITIHSFMTSEEPIELNNYPSFTNMFEEFNMPSGPIRRERQETRFNPIHPPIHQQVNPDIEQSEFHNLLHSISESHCNEQAQCANCYTISCKHVIKRCSGCRQIRYCSRQCQESNWAEHKEWCLAHRV